MHAKFPLAPDLELEVHSDRSDRAVGLTVVAGVPENTDCSGRVTTVSPVRTETYRLSPSTARAIASALMGAAAEV